jgi:protein AATF/BFR2
MSRNKKSLSIAEQINEVLKPKSLTEEDNEFQVEIEDFDENEDQPRSSQQFSDFRKQNAKQLDEIDSRYSGKVVSRKEMEDELLSSADDDEDAENSEEIEDSDLEEEDEERDSIDEEEDEEEDSMGEEEDEESDNEDDFDLSQFDKPSKQQSSDPQMKIMSDKSLDEEIKKGVSVQNQQKIWEKLLEVRIKSQKMLITANSLPDFDQHLAILEIDDDGKFSEKVDETCNGIHNLMDNLLEMQSILVKNFSETKNINLKRKLKQKSTGMLMKRSKLAEYSDLIEENNELYSNFRNQTLHKWHERTKSVKEMKTPVGNLDIMTKIKNAMLKKDEVIRKTQLYRGGFMIFGQDEKPENDIYLPEIFDDSEFYHQQLRELIEYKSGNDENQAEITQKLIELQKVRSKMKKKVDTRASKGRKIRYIVHNKLVNFMAPKDESTMPEEARKELFNSLFGAANQGELL